MAILVKSTIRTQEDDPALDLQKLYSLGLQHVRDWSKQIWTDYNVHDPGITTLELLCYALTDLGYRASLPVADLLATPDDNASNMAGQFFSAREILPNRPLTHLDYRKLLIDIPGIKNAWLNPEPLSYYADLPRSRLLHTNPGSPQVKPVEIKGLYHVRVDYMGDLNLAERDSALKAVQSTLHANRNLCEDFVSVSEVESENYLLCGEIELIAEADAIRIKAQILFEIQKYLAPTVSNYSLQEMLKKSKADGSAYRAEEIFNGPPLKCGFIPDEELINADLRTEIRLSDIINIIMDIPGVRAIKELIINPEAETEPPANPWRIDITPGKKALLNIAGSRLIFYKGQMPLLPATDAVKDAYDTLIAADRRKRETRILDDFPIPLGIYRDPGQYYAFQNHFPAVYGLGHNGLPAQANEQQKATVLQHKGYLLFFEQVLANYFAQLAQVRELFSTDPDLSRSYFYQTVDSFKAWQKIYTTPDPVATIQDSIEDKDILIDRRNRFLDHLISRFSEQFSEFANIMYSAFDLGPQALIQFKCDFLKNYPEISRDRGLAYNYSLTKNKDLWNSLNVSGLERRIAHLLGIRNFSRRNLSEIPYDVYAEIDTTPDDEFRFRIRHRVSNEILLSSSTKYISEADAIKEMLEAIFFASNPVGYNRKIASNGKHYFNIVNTRAEVVARRIEYFDNVTEMEAAISELIEYLQVNYSNEGMYLIENILLRPEKPNDPFLPICVDNNCQECSELDPYSYRLHIILPAENTRFSNMDFRRFAESVIRAEVPAHILPKICWINKQDMAGLESVYRTWISLKSGRTTANRQSILEKFIQRLFSVKNIYPNKKLHDCSAIETSEKFIVGHTALGSLADENTDDN